ncbi:LysR family transcriptional regulator [Psychromarinibacter sp. C21-152]|uniref:LysR family transcriptional regulator n=1 Tax=Psychromarinibacter sediminicola TaxID=3033385 RepID=A0AAE3NQN0_9RHOB|nr:LysR family transcriptional regulator [Psychromarinibacter sediminicola]MDF0599160.1 LysR family transcriptional regulator [Psychromarinibacter sediminicola]
MNWAAISFDWNHIRAFLASVEEGSLSAAARALGQSQPTLSRQIAALEAELGLVLFERVGRRLAPTPAALDLVAHVRAMGEAAGRISLTAAGRSEAVEGTVSVTASDSFSAYLLPGILGRLREVAPGITVDVVAANDIRDLQRREADIAVRHVRPEQPELVARLIRSSGAGLYAAPAYLAARGRPETVEALAGHDFVGFQPVDRFVELMNGFGVPVAQDRIRVVTDSGIVAWEMARAGLAIGVQAREVAALFPEMAPLLPEFEPIPVPIWLTCHRELHTSRRIRLVYDVLADALTELSRSDR